MAVGIPSPSFGTGKENTEQTTISTDLTKVFPGLSRSIAMPLALLVSAGPPTEA